MIFLTEKIYLEQISYMLQIVSFQRLRCFHSNPLARLRIT